MIMKGQKLVMKSIIAFHSTLYWKNILCLKAPKIIYTQQLVHFETGMSSHAWYTHKEFHGSLSPFCYRIKQCSSRITASLSWSLIVPECRVLQLYQSLCWKPRKWSAPACELGVAQIWLIFHSICASGRAWKNWNKQTICPLCTRASCALWLL